MLCNTPSRIILMEMKLVLFRLKLKCCAQSIHVICQKYSVFLPPNLLQYVSAFKDMQYFAIIYTEDRGRAGHKKCIFSYMTAQFCIQYT